MLGAVSGAAPTLGTVPDAAPSVTPVQGSVEPGHKADKHFPVFPLIPCKLIGPCLAGFKSLKLFGLCFTPLFASLLLPECP